MPRKTVTKKTPATKTPAKKKTTSPAAKKKSQKGGLMDFTEMRLAASHAANKVLNGIDALMPPKTVLLTKSGADRAASAARTSRDASELGQLSSSILKARASRMR